MPEKEPDYFHKYDFRNGRYFSYEELFSFEETKKYVREKISTVKEFKQKGNLLDVGCGFGYYLKQASKDFNVFGSDPSVYAIKKAGLRLNCSKKNLAVAGTESLPFKDDFFDVVMAIHSIEHVKDCKKALSECSRVLKKDGIFFLEFPTKLFEFPHFLGPTKKSVYKINKLLKRIGLGKSLQFVFDQTHFSTPWPWNVARGKFLEPHFKAERMFPEDKIKRYYSCGFSIIARPLK